MRQGLSVLVAFHWAGVFGLLAFFCMADPHAGASGALGLVGLTTDGGGGSKLAALLGLSFAVAAALFAWMLADCLFGRSGDGAGRAAEQMRKAFAAGALALLLLLGSGLWGEPSGSAFLVIEALLAALLVSYLVACADRTLPAALRSEDGWGPEAARSMAMGAAHNTLLSEMSGRAGEVPAGRF